MSRRDFYSALSRLGILDDAIPRALPWLYYPAPSGRRGAYRDGAMGNRTLRRARQIPASRKSPPKIPNATLAGSGTAVISSSQLTTWLSLPADRSAKNSVQVPFGFKPLSPLKVTRLAES